MNSCSRSRRPASPPIGEVLAEAGASIDRFLASGRTRNLGAKLGPINWQFLSTKAFDPVDFEAFLALLPNSIDGLALRHAVEAAP